MVPSQSAPSLARTAAVMPPTGNGTEFERNTAGTADASNA
jgi:hypothetical protein